MAKLRGPRQAKAKSFHCTDGCRGQAYVNMVVTGLWSEIGPPDGLNSSHSDEGSSSTTSLSLGRAPYDDFEHLIFAQVKGSLQHYGEPRAG